MTPSNPDVAGMLAQAGLGQAPAPQPQTAPTPTWWDVAKSIPDSAPDTAYDGARQAFFQKFVLPEMLQKGYDADAAERNFMVLTQRPGRTNFPRTKVVATEALSSLTSPLTGLLGLDADKSSLEASASDAVNVARRQGVWTPPYSFIGQAAGMTPYFAAGEAALAPLTSLAEGTEFGVAARALSVGSIQGAYDAASAPSGQRSEAFGKGALNGAALGAGFEALHGLAGEVRAAHDLTPAQADGVEQAAKGVATPTQENAATAALVNSNGLPQTVQQVASNGIAAAQKLGVPKDVQVDVPPAKPLAGPVPTTPVDKTPRIKIRMTGADGKPYTLGGGKGLPVDSTLDQTMALLSNHLANGASIEDLGGSKKAIQIFQNKLEAMSLTKKYQLPIKPVTLDANPVKPATTPVPLTDAPRYQPPKVVQDWIQSNPNYDDYDLRQKFNFGQDTVDKIRDWWEDERSQGVPRASFENPQPGDRVKHVFGKEYTGTIYSVNKVAGRNIISVTPDDLTDFDENTPRPLDSAANFEWLDESARASMQYLRPQDIESKWDAEAPGAWISPEGKVYNLAPGQTHGEVRDTPYEDAVADEEYGEEPSDWIQLRGNSISLKDLKSDALPQAFYEAAKYSRDNMVHVVTGDRQFSVPLEDRGEFLANPVKYSYPARARKSTRFAVEPQDIPEYDNYAQLPNGEVLNKTTGEVADSIAKLKGLIGEPPQFPEVAPQPKAYGRVRGSSDVPLSLPGIQQVSELGQRLRAKGSLDELYTADLTRHRQTAGLISAENLLTLTHPPDPAFRSWGLGGLEGEEHTPGISAAINSYVDNPSEAPPGFGPRSTQLGESFGSFAGRVINNVSQQLQRYIENPRKKIGIVTSSRDIGVIKSWLGADGDPDKFSEIMKRSHENPGAVYHVGLDESGSIAIRQVNPESSSQLQGGVYLIRHGETPWNQSAMEKVTTKQTPLGLRVQGPSDMLQSASEPGAVAKGLTIGTSRFYDSALDRATIAHERYHALTDALKMHGAVMNIMDHPITSDLYDRGFDPAVKAAYGTDPYIWREEVYAHSLDAIRTNNIPKISDFVAADTDEPTYMQWFRDMTQRHLDVASGRPDSIYKRAYERALNDANNRATRYLDDINNAFSQADSQLGLHEGDYVLYDQSTGARTSYPNRELALRDLEAEQQPLNAAELVNMDRLPDDVPRFARRIRTPDGKRPILTDPPDPAIGERVPARGGFGLFSYFLRPFHAWLGTVAERNDWPELYDKFRAIDDAQVDYNNFVRPYVQELKDTLAKAAPERQKDFFEWMRTTPGRRLGVEQKLLFKPEELAMLSRFREKFLDPLAKEFRGVSFENYLNDTLPRINHAGDVYKAFPDMKADNFMVRKLKTGQLDPDDENLLRVAGKYMEFGARDKFTEPALNAAEAEVNSRIPLPGAVDITDLKLTTPRAGALRPLLQRELDNLRGRPDYTNLIVKGAMQDATGWINKGIDNVNKIFPKSMQIPNIDEISEDPLGKFTLFQYAGTLGLKPATLIRDSLQYFITTYPIAGNYAFKGMRKAFPAFKLGSEAAKQIWDTARHYGALIERSDLASLYAAADTDAEHVGEHNIENFAKWTLGAIQFSHNSNRLAAFWGHSEQVADALEAFRRNQDLGKFNRKSGMWFLDKPLRDQFNHEMQIMDPNPTAAQDFAHRVAARLVETSQWNLRRGANPGLYNFSLGRLFGQYGTWPLNYIEYARRFATATDRGAARDAMIRLVLSHGAILAAGQSAGIDTGRWTFTQPAADWQGGPIFEMLMNAPKSLDFDTTEGEEARKSIREEFFPGMIPGGDEAGRIYEALTTEDPDFWKKMLGFHVLQSADYERGLHQFLPKEQ